MCEVCEEVELHTRAMLILAPVVNRKTVTEKQMATALQFLHETGNDEMTAEELEEMSLNELCAIISTHAAMATAAVERDGKPLSHILGEWAGLALHAEMMNAAEQIFNLQSQARNN